MAVVTRRDLPFQLPELPDWVEAPMAGWREYARLIRIEDFVAESRYVVRAELPGVEPDKEIEVTVEEGLLRIRAERAEETRQQCRSEFRYGTLHRIIRLPREARQEDIKATYKNGVLEVSIGLAEETKSDGRRVTVESAG